MRRTLIMLASLAGLALAIATPAAASSNGPAVPAIYNSIPAYSPGNLPSVGAEAYAFDEFGDQVEFVGKSRVLSNVEVLLSDWACEEGHWYDVGGCSSTPGNGFSLPMTLNIYEAEPEGAVGKLLASDTQTFNIPYRPSDSPLCPEGQQWYDRRSKACDHGLATTVTFDFTSQSITLPNKVIYGITYDTSHYGRKPIGSSAPCYSSSAGCGYDSLNIALAERVLVGAQTVPGTVYQDSPYGFEYCDGGLAGVDLFRLDSPTSHCWEGYVPAVAFKATNGRR